MGKLGRMDFLMEYHKVKYSGDFGYIVSEKYEGEEIQQGEYIALSENDILLIQANRDAEKELHLEITEVSRDKIVTVVKELAMVTGFDFFAQKVYDNKIKRVIIRVCDGKEYTLEAPRYIDDFGYSSKDKKENMSDFKDLVENL